MSDPTSPAPPHAPAAPAEGLGRTADYWATLGRDMARRAHWQAHPVVQEVFAQRRAGLSCMQRLATRLGRTPGAALGLGAGAASAELELLGMNAVSSYELYDVTPTLLEAAESAAEAAGLRDRIRCAVVDINQLDLPPNSYDLVTFVSSLHHVERLERVLAQCYSALRPGGVFYAQEYIGPNRFAFPREQTSLARQIYRTLDPRLRSAAHLPTPDPLAVAAADPTESIRSEEIVALCRRVFSTMHIVSEEVCLTLILWYGLNYTSLYETQEGHDLVRWLIEIDQSLVRSGRVPTYHAEIFARKPGGAFPS